MFFTEKTVFLKVAKRGCILKTFSWLTLLEAFKSLSFLDNNVFFLKKFSQDFKNAKHGYFHLKYVSEVKLAQKKQNFQKLGFLEKN